MVHLISKYIIRDLPAPENEWSLFQALYLKERFVMRSQRTRMFVMSLVLLLVVSVGYFAYANNLVPFLQTSTGTIASPDGSVELHIPDGVQLPGTHKL